MPVLAEYQTLSGSLDINVSHSGLISILWINWTDRQVPFWRWHLVLIIAIPGALAFISIFGYLFYSLVTKGWSDTFDPEIIIRECWKQFFLEFAVPECSRVWDLDLFLPYPSCFLFFLLFWLCFSANAKLTNMQPELTKVLPPGCSNCILTTPLNRP